MGFHLPFRRIRAIGVTLLFGVAMFALSGLLTSAPNAAATGATAYRPDPNGPIGFNQPSGLAFDSEGNLWVSNNLGNSISKVTFPRGVPTALPPYFLEGLSGPNGLAFDVEGNLWVVNQFDNSIERITFPGGVPTGSTP